MDYGRKSTAGTGNSGTDRPAGAGLQLGNVGLLVDAGRPVTSIMTALDITADVVRDAAESGCELIVSHHPVIFDRCAA